MWLPVYFKISIAFNFINFISVKPLQLDRICQCISIPDIASEKLPFLKKSNLVESRCRLCLRYPFNPIRPKKINPQNFRKFFGTDNCSMGEFKLSICQLNDFNGTLWKLFRPPNLLEFPMWLFNAVKLESFSKKVSQLLLKKDSLEICV